MMTDQIIDATMARSIQVDVGRTHALSSWVVLEDPPDYPGKVIARLLTDRPTLYVLVADNLRALQAQLPRDLVRSERQLTDLPELVEIWFTK
jgi:hypothetical protein